MALKTNRILALDALRGIAAIMVVLFHYTTRFNNLYGHIDRLPFQVPFGSDGVLLFFMISGFVIFMTLEKTVRPLDFIVSRFSRLYPTYWFCLLVTFCAVYFSSINDRKVTFFQAIINLSMIQNLLHIPSVDGVYWSLSIELIFYGIMLCLFCIKKLQKIEIIAFFWLLVQFLAILFPEISQQSAIGQITSKFILLKFAHLFVAGIIFYRIFKTGDSTRRFLILSFCLLNQFLSDQLVSSSLVVVFFFVFYLFAHGKLRLITIKPLVYLGTISYPLYLTHQNIGYIILLQLISMHCNYIVSFLMTLLIALLIASLITFLIEQPVRNMIKKWYKNHFPYKTTPMRE